MEAEKYRQEAGGLQERWDRLLEVESREQLWQRPCKAAVAPFVTPGQRATRFVAAGGDIIITAKASLTATMVDALVDKAQQDKAFGALLKSSVRRVLALRCRVLMGQHG